MKQERDKSKSQVHQEAGAHAARRRRRHGIHETRRVPGQGEMLGSVAADCDFPHDEILVPREGEKSQE